MPHGALETPAPENTHLAYFFMRLHQATQGRGLTRRSAHQENLDKPLLFFLSSILIFASLQCLLLTLTDKSRHFLNLNISPQCVIRGGC